MLELVRDVQYFTFVEVVAKKKKNEIYIEGVYFKKNEITLRRELKFEVWELFSHSTVASLESA